MAGHEPLGFGDVVGTLDEGKRDPIEAEFERKGEILAVLVGHRRNRQQDVGNVDTLAVEKRAARGDHGLHRRFARPLDPQPDASIVQEQFDALTQHREHFRVRQLNPFSVARRRIEVQAEGLAHGELGSALAERTDADLGSLQIGERADGMTEHALDFAHDGEAGGVLFVAAVAEVEAKDIGPRLGHGADALERRARRSQSGDNLGRAVAAHGKTIQLNLTKRGAKTAPVSTTMGSALDPSAPERSPKGVQTPPSVRNGRPREKLPELVRFLIRHALIGIASGWALLFALLWSDAAGLGTLLFASEHWLLTLLLAMGGFAVTFGSLAMGTAIFLLPRE